LYYKEKTILTDFLTDFNTLTATVIIGAYLLSEALVVIHDRRYYVFRMIKTSEYHQFKNVEQHK